MTRLDMVEEAAVRAAEAASRAGVAVEVISCGDAGAGRVAVRAEVRAGELPAVPVTFTVGADGLVPDPAYDDAGFLTEASAIAGGEAAARAMDEVNRAAGEVAGDLERAMRPRGLREGRA